MIRRAGSKRAGARGSRRGFTLVELMITIVIVGVLSLLAISGYRKMIVGGKITEAQNMVMSIRAAQETYFLQHQGYANVGTTLCPTAAAPGKRVQWDPSCNGGNMVWRALDVHAHGQIEFQYATQAGPPGVPNGVFVGLTQVNTTKPWYVVTAEADLDPNTPAKTQVVATSFNTQLFVNNEGQ